MAAESLREPADYQFPARLGPTREIIAAAQPLEPVGSQPTRLRAWGVFRDVSLD